MKLQLHVFSCRLPLKLMGAKAPTAKATDNLCASIVTDLQQAVPSIIHVGENSRTTALVFELHPSTCTCIFTSSTAFKQGKETTRISSRKACFGFILRMRDCNASICFPEHCDWSCSHNFCSKGRWKSSLYVYTVPPRLAGGTWKFSRGRICSDLCKLLGA